VLTLWFSERTRQRGAQRWLAALVACCCLIPIASARAQSTAASLSGTVQDGQGAAIPGAIVTVTSNRRGTSESTTTNGEGFFTIPQLPPDTYTLKISLEGFKSFERSAVVLTANERASAGTIALDLGAVSEIISVTSRVQELQTASAERGYALEGKVLQDVAVNSRSYLALVGLQPGVVNTANLTFGGHAGLGNISANGARMNTNNLTLDGIGDVDTGNNGDQLATLSLDAVSEFKILTANYQAEYGRSSGAQISVVTKSGGRDFSGSGYWYRRDDGLNATNWVNNRDGQPKNPMRLNDFGYTIGGPVYLPGKFNSDRSKLFFFAAEEFQRQLRPQAIRRLKLPTALERQGDFSQSRDNNGNPYPYIRDASTGLPCSATDTRGCFQDGGVLGRIPASRLYQPGLNILNVFPQPNASGKDYNYTSQISDSYPRREDIIRVDWNPADSWRIYGRYINNNDSVTSAYGSFVLGANFPLVPITDTRPGSNFAISATKVLNPRMVNEATFGYGYNRINIDPVNDGLTRTARGLTGLPLLYPSAVQNDFMPQFSFGTRAATTTGPNFGTNNAPFFNYNRTIDFVDNFSWVLSNHTLKTGMYIQRSQKDQTSFANSSGNINFGENTANPLDSTYGYANAALGIFNTYNQASQYATGHYRYSNIEWYVQDNWKVSNRLTLDYGIRFYWIQPQYDQGLQTSTFLPGQWNASQAPRLFVPAIGPDGKRAGYDAVTGQYVADFYIGRIVPNSGNGLDGIFQAGQGVSKYLMENRGIQYAPRFGFTYDLTGKQSLIVRGGGGVFYDRFQGNETFDMITNPPTTVSPTLSSGQLRDVNPNNILLAPSGLNAFSFDGKIPTVYNFNLGVQMKLPSEFILDVSYVGAQGRHLLERRNLNAVQYGAAFDPANQDPTRAPSTTPGANSLPADFLRPYRGYGNINIHEMGANYNYNSLQTSLDRRFSRGLLLGVAYTWGKSLGTVDADGNFHRIDGFDHQANYGLLNVDRRHTFTANFVYEIPSLASKIGGSSLASGIFDRWQVSGIYRAVSGAPYTPGFSIDGTSNQNLTGSFTEGARIAVNGDPGKGNSGDPYQQIAQSVFAAPQVGSKGLESGRNWLIGPGVNNLDLSIQKNVQLVGRSMLQFRADAFNVLNHTQFSGVNATLNFNSSRQPTNLPFDATGKLVNVNGFGTINGARDPRIVQLVMRLQF
jgi:hypothetical protein